MDRQFFDDFCDRMGFPDEYRSVVFPLIDRIEKEYLSEFEAIDADRCTVDGYYALADKMGKERDAVMLAVCIKSGILSKKRYEAMGIPDGIYYASMRDITIWAKRCFIERGHVGVYAHDWLNNFFDPHVFRIGRLEFERKQFPTGYEYSRHGVTVHGGDGVINIHIPEDGPLRHDEVLKSYKAAYKFFGLCGKYPFVTHSWLIWEKNGEFLPERSNIRDFMGDYDIVYSEEGKDPCNLWRVFGRRESYDPATLPRENSLQRNFADYLATHDGLNGVSYGIFIHDGEKIIKD